MPSGQPGRRTTFLQSTTILRYKAQCNPSGNGHMRRPTMSLPSSLDHHRPNHIPRWTQICTTKTSSTFRKSARQCLLSTTQRPKQRKGVLWPLELAQTSVCEGESKIEHPKEHIAIDSAARSLSYKHECWPSEHRTTSCKHVITCSRLPSSATARSRLVNQTGRDQHEHTGSEGILSTRPIIPWRRE